MEADNSVLGSLGGMDNPGKCGTDPCLQACLQAFDNEQRLLPPIWCESYFREGKTLINTLTHVNLVNQNQDLEESFYMICATKSENISL